MKLTNSCLWCLWNVILALVVWTNSMLIFPNNAKKYISCQIRHFLYRVHYWNSFQAKVTPWSTPGLREEKAGPWCLCHQDRRSRYGKESSMAFLSKDALEMESVCGSECMKQPRWRQSLVFWSFFNGHSALCCFSHLWKQGIVIPKLPSIERRTRLKCLSHNGNSLHLTRAPRWRGNRLLSLPYL